MGRRENSYQFILYFLLPKSYLTGNQKNNGKNIHPILEDYT